MQYGGKMAAKYKCLDGKSVFMMSHTTCYYNSSVTLHPGKLWHL